MNGENSNHAENSHSESSDSDDEQSNSAPIVEKEVKCSSNHSSSSSSSSSSRQSDHKERKENKEEKEKKEHKKEEKNSKKRKAELITNGDEEHTKTNKSIKIDKSVEQQDEIEGKNEKTETDTKTDPLFKDEELHCIVCFEFPGGEIYQCEHGHLLCDGCHKRVVEGHKPVCPSCSVKLSRDRPHRNRFAEIVISRLIVTCANEGCGTRIEFANIQQHEKQTCVFRKVKCKFQPIGCDWVGIAKEKRPHEKSCSIRTKSPKHILKRVIQRNIEKQNEFKKTEDSLVTQKQVCKLLASRCKDIHIRDVILEKDTVCDEFCSKTFTAVGLAWEAILSKPTDAKFGLTLRAVSSIKKKICSSSVHSCWAEL